jgi:uncharacterized membrane protein YhaH (DUF805 family)
MSLYLLLAFQFVSPVLAGIVLIRYLQDTMTRLLTELCGNETRAEFWVKVCASLLVITPLFLVLLAAQSPLQCDADALACLEITVRETVARTFLGILLTLGAVTFAVSRYIDAPLRADLTEPDAQKNTV